MLQYFSRSVLFVSKVFQGLLDLVPVWKVLKRLEHLASPRYYQQRVIIAYSLQSKFPIKTILIHKTSPHFLRDISISLLAQQIIIITSVSFLPQQTMAQFHRITQAKTNFQVDSSKAMNKLLAKSKQRKQMILLLLNQQRFYQHQNHQALRLNKTPQEYKLSQTKHKFGDRVKTTKIIRGASLTPKFKKHMQSLSKLPPLKQNEEKEIKRKDEKLSPWQYKESKDLLRPVSSRFLPY